MKQIKVLKENCIGCGACVAIDSEHFAFDDKGKSCVISNENLESGNLVNALESCPTAAISMVEEESTTVVENNTEDSVADNDEVVEQSCENCCGCHDGECDSTECECNGDTACSKEPKDEKEN